jgi:hypothetical protein
MTHGGQLEAYVVITTLYDCGMAENDATPKALLGVREVASSSASAGSFCSRDARI